MRAFAEFSFRPEVLKGFEAACQAAIRNVDHGTKRATEAAAKDIYYNSMRQVPKMTNTLLDSAFYEVHRRADITGYKYEAVIGYGGNGDPVNPITGQRASRYMTVVHEDLFARHWTGKAKFLEDPVREYGEKYFERVIFKHVQDSLASMSD